MTNFSFCQITSLYSTYTQFLFAHHKLLKLRVLFYLNVFPIMTPNLFHHQQSKFCSRLSLTFIRIYFKFFRPSHSSNQIISNSKNRILSTRLNDMHRINCIIILFAIIWEDGASSANGNIDIFTG